MPIPLGIVAEEGKNVNPYWLTMSDYPTGSTNTQYRDNTVTYDIANNTYWAIRYGPAAVVVVKQSLRGDILWRKSIPVNLASVLYITNIVVDNAQNVYVGAGTFNSPFTSFYYKLDINGNIVWTRSLSYTPTPLSIGQARLTIDNAQNLIIAASQSISTTQTGIEILKINSDTGNIIWQQRYAHTNNTVGVGLFSNVVVDSNNNIYFFGTYVDPVFSAYFGGVVKFSANGTALWHNRIYNNVPTNRLLFSTKISAGTDGSIYVVQNTASNASGGPNIRIVKCDTNGAFLWNDTLLTGDASIQFQPQIAACDSNNNLYCIGLYTPIGGGASRYHIVRKASSNGAIIWQNQLISGITMRSNTVDGAVNNIQSYFAFPVLYGTNFENAAYFKVPLNGSRTGTYTLDTVGWQYSANSLSSGTETLSNASLLQTQFAGNLFFQTVSNPTVTNFTGSFFTTNLI